MADSGTYSNKIDEEHACESFSIRPYQFEQRVSSDEAVSNPEDLGYKCIASDEETDVKLYCEIQTGMLYELSVNCNSITD